MIMLFLFVIGAALGSFSLVMAWRMYEGKDWVKGRSECDKCHKPLKPLDMIPVLSWILLRGRCRYCKKRLSAQLVLAELLLGATAALSYAYWPHELDTALSWAYFGLWMLVLTIFSVLFWFDFRWKELPTKLMYFLIGLAFIEACIEASLSDGTLVSGILSAVYGAAIFAGLFYLIYYFSKGKLIGDGDIPLLFALGLIAGSPAKSFLLVFIASILGTLVSLPFMAFSKLKMKSQIPFGPLLITAAVIVQVFGETILTWYRSFTGL